MISETISQLESIKNNIKNIIIFVNILYLFVLTQHSLNCLASIGDVKFKPQVSLLCGSFQYAKHSEANPIFVPKK